MNNEFEFQGTKGKWTKHKRAYCYVVSDNGNVIANCGGRTSNVNSEQLHTESMANTQLVSKSPELFEMLKKAKTELSRIKGSMMAHPDCVQGSEFDDYITSAEECENDIEQLLKECTEI